MTTIAPNQLLFVQFPKTINQRQVDIRSHLNYPARFVDAFVDAAYKALRERR